MSSRHPSWPLTSLPLTGIFALIMHLHVYTLRHTLSVEKCTHTYKLPSQLGSHPPIRQRKLADCDPSATLCLNCSPSACCNERLPVYSGCAFSLPLQLSLYFPSMDAGVGKKEDLMMCYICATSKGKEAWVKKVQGVRMWERMSMRLKKIRIASMCDCVCVCTHLCLKWVKWWYQDFHACLSSARYHFSPKPALSFYSNCEKMLQSLFSQIQWNGEGLLSALCLTHMIGCGEHATSNCKLQSCTSLDGGRKRNSYLKKKNFYIAWQLLVDILCYKGHALEHTCTHARPHRKPQFCALWH